MSQRKTGTILVYLKTILSVAISLIYTPFMLKALGQSEYGSINLASSMVSYLNLIGLGVSASYIRFNMRCRNAHDHEKEMRLNGTYFLMFCTMGFVALLAGTVLTLNIDKIAGSKILPSEYRTIQILMAICVLNIALAFPGSIFRMMLNAYERFAVIHIVELAASVLQPGVGFLLLLMGYKSVALQSVVVALNFAQIAINAYYALRILKLRFSFKGICIGDFREIFTFSAFIFINQIVNTINWNVDNYLTAFFIGTAGTAVYAFGYQFINYYMTLSTSISNVFAPAINKLVLNDDKANLNDCFVRIGRIQFLLLAFVWAIFVVIGKDFVILFSGGEEYLESYYIAVILMGATLIPLSQNLGIEVQRAMNKHKFRSILYLSIAIGNLLISIPLCKWLGAFGCAVGTAMGQIVGNVIIMNIYYIKQIGLDIKAYYKSILGLFPALAVSFAVCFTVHRCVVFELTKYSFFLEGVLCVFVFAMILWLFGMNKYEKDLVKTTVLPLFNKKSEN